MYTFKCFSIKRYLSKSIVGLLGLLLLVVACSKPEARYPVQYQELTPDTSFGRYEAQMDSLIIADYIEHHPTLKFKPTSYGIWYGITKETTVTTQIEEGDMVTYRYAIKNFSGQTIYNQEEVGLQKAIKNKTKIIRGINDSFNYLKEGNHATLLVPSFSAYQLSGDKNKIAPAQPIIIEIELLNVQKSI